MIRRGLPGLVLACLCALPAAAVGNASSLARWVEGPVRYLITSAEAREFRELETEGARVLFIERFWLRRDPTAGTLRNEYREEFWARVEDANLRFATVGPGWKTDRGRILVLLGWPERIESEDFPDVDSSPQIRSVDGGSFSDTSEGSGVEVDAGFGRGYRGVERWYYRNTEQASLGPNLIVAFARDLSDEYRIAGDASLYGARFPSGGLGSAFRSPIQLPGSAVNAVGPSTGLSLPDLPRISSLPGLVRFELADAVEVEDPRRLATEVVTSQEFLALFPFRSRWLYFLAPGDGRTIVLTGLEVPGPALYGPEPPRSLVSYLLCYLSFDDPGDEREPVLADNENAPRRVTFGEAGQPLETWAGSIIDPGAYRVAVGLVDAATGRVASLREDIEVPDLSGPGPQLSSLLLASSFPDGVNVRPPIRQGSSYRPDEIFLLYYELYGLAAAYEVAYRFAYEEGDRWLPVGEPVDAGPRTPGRQGWEFPLGAFPPGRYRLTVEAWTADGRTRRREVFFEVAPASGS